MSARYFCFALIVVVMVSASLAPVLEVWAAAKTPTPTPTVPKPPDAVIAGKTVNVRSGPSTSFARLLSLTQGTPLFVIGQTSNCAWLKVKTQSGREGWVARTSGGKTLVTLNKPCASVPTAKAPTPPPKPAATAVRAAQPTSTPVPQQVSPLDDPNLGCYQMENYLGVELNVTINAVNWRWSDNFKVGPMGQHVICLAPGKYTYTIDAPPPWSNINGELTAEAGDRLRWPISGRQ